MNPVMPSSKSSVSRTVWLVSLTLFFLPALFAESGASNERSPKSEGFSDPAPNIAGMSIIEASERSGYTPAEIKAYFPPIQEWDRYDPDLKPNDKAEGYAADRFSTPPKPGVHPRIYFNAEDIPNIRAKLYRSHVSKKMMELLRGRCLQIAPTPQPWDACSALKEPTREKIAGRNIYRLKLRRMGYHGPWIGGWVNDLASGKDPADLKGTWGKPIGETKGRQYLMHLMPHEAFRCLIDGDDAGMERIGRALATICRLFEEANPDLKTKTDYQGYYQLIGSDSIGVTYDWAYNHISETDRDTVRKFIAMVTNGKTSIGFDHLPAYPGGTSNWNTIHMHLIGLVLAIEGEEGYDPDVYQGCVEVMRKWCYVATGPLGAPFEGYNKSSYAGQHLLALARRGHNFLGTTWVKNAGSRYHMAVMLPWGTEHIYETQSGPEVLPRDFAPFKFAYPKDLVIDLVYGNIMQDFINDDSSLSWVSTRTTYSPFFPYLIYYDDPMGMAQDGRYNFKARADRVVKKLSLDKFPTFYYSDYRGLMTSRTSWDADAAFLFFEPRNVPGGHTWDSRGDFIIASHGRSWNHRPSGTEGSSQLRSVILIDGEGQGHQCVQGRTLYLHDDDKATVATGDATWAYSYKAGGNNDEKVMHTPNDSRLYPSKLPWMDQPWSFLPDWRNGRIGGDRHGHWRKHNEIEYAYRTVVLAKSKMPYFIVRDDMKKDNEPHSYNWTMQIPDDLSVIKEAAINNGALEMVLGDEQGRRLLVRVLEAGSSMESLKNTRAQLCETSFTYRDKTSIHKRLEVEVRDTIGNCTVLLFPYTMRQSQPEDCRFTDSELVVEVKGQFRDTYSIGRDSSGMSHIKVK